MNAYNNFTVTGYVCKDAEIKNFEKSDIARFGVILKQGKDDKQVTAILGCETFLKKGDAEKASLLKKGSFIRVNGFFKPESYTAKDGSQVNTVKLVATEISVPERKEAEQEDNKPEQA